jgi:DNA polymerase-3 subunit gamma/tau
MEQYTVSARKFRPDSFDKVVGQQHVTNTLKNALLNNCLAQAFLFCGPRGVGKTTCARILAKAINCEQLTTQGEPCNVCEACSRSQIKEGGSVFELDAASNNSVDDIRMLVEQVRYVPQVDKYKVYIVDEVHMLSNSAFNAFLKTLEEPPKHAIFILATTEKHKIIPTILSRCQIFDFRRVKTVDIVNQLIYIAQARKITYEVEALHIIAEKADGALRDALSLLDMVASFEAKGNITYKSVIENLHIIDYEYFFVIVKSCSEHDINSCFLEFNNLLEQGFDGQNFISGLSNHLRNLLVCKYDDKGQTLLDVSESIKELYKKQAAALTIDFIIHALDIISKYDLQYKNSYNKRVLVEMMLVALGNIGKDLSVKNIVEVPSVESSAKVNNAPTQIIDKIDKIIDKEVDKAYIEKALDKFDEKKPLKMQRSMSTTKIPKLDSLQKIKNYDNIMAPVIDTDIQHKKPHSVKTLTKPVIEKLINKYANKLNDNGSMAEYNTLCSKMEILGTNISFIFTNAIQLSLLENMKPALISFLKEELKLDEIQIYGSIEIDNNAKKPYTDREKLDSIVGKVPIIEDLINRFSLELE